MAKRSSPEVNAGSMADIAFLLLIFFLVTTTMDVDSGISRKLPPMPDSEEDVIIKQKNIFTVILNGKDQLLVEDEVMELEVFWIMEVLYLIVLNIVIIVRENILNHLQIILIKL